MNENFAQNLDEKAPERTMLMAQVLFREKPAQVPISTLQKTVEKILGDVELVYDAPNAPFFALKSYRAVFQKEEGKEYKNAVDNGDGTVSMPVLANFIIGEEFDPKKVDAFTRSQFWDYQGDFDGFKYQTASFGMLSGGMDYKRQAELFVKQIEVVLECFPEAEAIFVPHSGKLTSVEHFRQVTDESLAVRFIRTAVNARFFRIENSEDSVIDTLGFFAFGAPDIQVHFHGLDPNSVVGYVYSIASYQFNEDFPVQSGDTIDGLDDNGSFSQTIQWSARYEDSLIQPLRTVLDINCGKYAAGGRS